MSQTVPLLLGSVHATLEEELEVDPALLFALELPEVLPMLELVELAAPEE
jgi:hypothetical protein